MTDRARRARDGNFVLALKSELPLLCRLDAIKRVLPQARIVACIDNPFDTIAAWKRGSAALRDGDTAMLAGGTDAPWLTRSESDGLRDITASSDPAERRAMLWWWLAQCLLDQAHGVIVLRRRDVIVDRQASLRRVLQGLHPGRSRMFAADTEARSANGLDDRDLQAIRAICSQAAADLGVRSDV